MSAVVVFQGECTVDVPRQVRRVLSEMRADVGIPDKVVDDLVLVATELLTNAVRAGSRDVTVELDTPPPHLTIKVTDDAPGHPQQVVFVPDGASGRGLAILESIADQWGYVPAEDRKTVWARLDPHLPDAAPGSG